MGPGKGRTNRGGPVSTGAPGNHTYARVVELVATQELKSCAIKRESSSLFSGTTKTTRDLVSYNSGLKQDNLLYTLCKLTRGESLWVLRTCFQANLTKP